MPTDSGAFSKSELKRHSAMGNVPGIPGIWEGDPKAIGQFLRFVHGQLQNICPGVLEGELAMVIRSLSGECERALHFAEGYAAARQ